MAGVSWAVHGELHEAAYAGRRDRRGGGGLLVRADGEPSGCRRRAGQWVTDFNPRTRAGTVVGVLGGYQEGGSTPAVSYSSYLGEEIQWLYRQAVADEAAPAG